MPVTTEKHRLGWPDYFTIAGALLALCVFGLLALNSCARVLANWQTGHW